MTLKLTDGLKDWIATIVDPDGEISRKISDDPAAYLKLFREDLAHFLYEDMCRSRMLVTSPFVIIGNYDSLKDSEKKIWQEYASEIPSKLNSLGLKIRPAGEYYSSCIITEEDIEKLAGIDHEKFTKDHVTAFHELPGARKWYFKELNYLIPPQLKKIGFELIRPGEESLISKGMLRKLAKAIHSRYLKEMRDRGTIDSASVYPGDQDQFLMEFDDLPEEIKFSNIDNAYHIATKLLAIGYRIKPVKEGFESITLHLNQAEIEAMAKIEHDRWSWDKRLNGWIFGNIKDNQKKTHPGLIPYEDLNESEKEKDRELVRLIPALLQDIGYVAYAVSPDRLLSLSYALKPKSSIHNLLNETRRLNDEIRDLSLSNPAIVDKIGIINKKIGETIDEVRGNYNYARHIQKTYLPDDLYIRECFPDSFVLFKPKDIVSGDFYYFSKQSGLRFFAAADCTGHGIPGALLSTLGYVITDQAVNEIGLKNPAEILCHVYSRVHKFLRRDDDLSGVYDDMDIALCCLDINTRILRYAGVSSPLYRISKGEISEYRATNLIDGCNEGNTFTFENIQTLKGDIIYLCSDGFADQFGGRLHKKYQRPRLKSFLLSIHQLPMSEQKDLLYEEFENWREENDEDQTDDILIIGVKI
jgi:serine phosphatase RsbU (regulator of sigma subunit)